MNNPYMLLTNPDGSVHGIYSSDETPEVPRIDCKPESKVRQQLEAVIAQHKFQHRK